MMRKKVATAIGALTGTAKEVGRRVRKVFRKEVPGQIPPGARTIGDLKNSPFKGTPNALSGERAEKIRLSDKDKYLTYRKRKNNVNNTRIVRKEGQRRSCL